MPLRLILAWIAGWITYMIAMAMTVYDGFPSLLFQPFMGAICASVGVLAVLILGSPLLIPRLWTAWTKVWWIPIVLVVISVFAMILSWFPGFRTTVYDQELQRQVETFHPVLSICGWFGILFSLVWFPVLSIRNAVGLIKRTPKT